jgi:hypothetical protein
MTLAPRSRQALDEHLHSLVAGRFAVRPAKELGRAVDHVRKRFGNGQADLVTRDRVEAAVRSLASGHEPNGRELFILSHAMAQPVRVLDSKTLLESRHCDGLLSRWEKAVARGDLRATHWRGLFRSFMQAEDGEGCERLRRLLRGSVGSLRAGRSVPVWLAAARRHEALLGNAPCRAYVAELLAGESAMLDDLRAEIDVPPASWFWRALCEAVLAQIAELQEATFKSRIPHLLSLPEKIPNASNAILGAILSRYANCADRSRHVQLLESALDAWGSPQLKSNTAWLGVSNEARQMVCGWLAQEDLEDFYRVCKGARQIDDRRLRFWLRFKEQMGYTQILLGGSLRYSRDADVKDFIRKKKGRLGELTSGPASNNAIIMQIGGWIFIEFSETGNACYAYPVDDHVIELGRKTYSLGSLRPASKNQMRMLHMDGRETWEQKFDSELRGVGVLPDDKAARSATAPRGDWPVRSTQRQPASRSSTPNVPDGVELLERLRKLHVRIVDNRSKGGAIWAYAIGSTLPHAELKALGMKFKADKDGYYWP